MKERAETYRGMGFIHSAFKTKKANRKLLFPAAFFANSSGNQNFYKNKDDKRRAVQRALSLCLLRPSVVRGMRQTFSSSLTTVSSDSFSARKSSMDSEPPQFSMPATREARISRRRLRPSF